MSYTIFGTVETKQTNIVKIWNDFRSGDKKAFSFLYESYFDVLYRYGMKFVSDPNIVKDCIQDLFVKIYINRENISPTTGPKFYLLFSLKNLIIDHLTKNHRITYVSPGDLPFFVAYQYEDEKNEIDDEIKYKFESILSLLNPRQKEALYLRFQLELSYEEISKLLGINYQSARNLIHRSIVKIRENMEFSVFLLLFLHNIG